MEIDKECAIVDAHVKLDGAINVLNMFIDRYNLDAGKRMSDDDLRCIKYDADAFTSVLNMIVALMHDASENMKKYI